ncbi:MAG TPA: UbiD family decarboxylase [Saprospiraceae bacterium]|nr:UbiD family decarboxylase [Saprospiraceae bacterium]
MYKSMQEVVKDLEANNMLLRIKHEVDPNLEVAEIHRQVYDKDGPAIFFEKIKGSPFPGLSNLYGTIERTEFLFRKTLPKVKKVIELKADPTRLLKNPLRYIGAPFTALTALPMKSIFGSPVMYGQTTIDQLPMIKSWPMDGGAFITLPQVFSLPPDNKNIMQSNLGMYRIQLSGNEYIMNDEIGLHYQIHRGIGVHHEMYNKSDEPFKVSIFVGGLPSHAFSAIMPLPEGLSELTFAGMLADRRFRYKIDDMGHVVSSDADFVITGTIMKNKKKPEGPFGDHLGYYSLTHDFPIMKVDRVYHRKDAIWHFTVVGRPPQEDSSFGYLIHQLVKDLAAQEFPGLKEIHAVDAAGVHPLLLAIGKERYMPFREPRPEEILTIANRILGSGQTSLAKYLIIAADEDDPSLDTHDIATFFKHVLERIDWQRDLHFQTKTTIDTLDYSGEDWNGGSKVVWACRSSQIRKLAKDLPIIPENTIALSDIKVVLPGILAYSGPKFTNYDQAKNEVDTLIDNLEKIDLEGFPLIILCDDASFTAESLNNFVWVTFTRSNPSHDVYGIGSFTKNKHWGCKGSLIIDARKKPHHAPELVTDKAIEESVAKWLKF